MIAERDDAFGNFDFFELAVIFDERAVFDHEKAVDLVLMQMDGLRVDIGCLGNVCGDCLVRTVYFDVCAALCAFRWNQWHVFLPLRYFR